MDEVTIAVSTTQQPTKGERTASIRNGLLCAAVIAVCWLVVWPFGNTPSIDDFSYAKTALEFARTGHFVYNGWATAMLGWQIPWGALFIKLFGFSFNILRVSMLPIDMATVLLFHRILCRFGIASQNAMVGALTLVLSPVCLPMVATYMTDMPGLFVILLCIYMCQRAVAASSDRAAILWLCFATFVNIAGGTVRQIAWLGALIMVPSTAWLLRRRRGIKTAGILLWAITFVSVLGCMHWFSLQPYAISGYLSPKTLHPKLVLHLAAQILKALLCLLLLIFPVTVAWFTAGHRLTFKAKVQVAGAVVLLVVIGAVLYQTRKTTGWTMPWLMYFFAGQGAGFPDTFGTMSPRALIWIRILISLLVISPAFFLIARLAEERRSREPDLEHPANSFKTLVVILGPFSLSYLFLLLPSGTFTFIQARYLMGLAPAAIAVPLWLYQKRVGPKLGKISLVALIMFATFSVAGTHDYFSHLRAQVRAIEMLRDAGVSRGFIQVGMENDGWEQVKDDGHMNDPRIRIPNGTYNPSVPEIEPPADCSFGFAGLTPAIKPKYFLNFPPIWCFAPTKYPPVRFTAWLPPFHRAIYVQKLKSDVH